MRWIFSFLCLYFSFGCAQTAALQDGIYYFKSWAAYKIPFRPVGKISQEEALKLESYHIGYYSSGLLTKFEEYRDNKLYWQDIYTYWPNTKILQKREMYHFAPTVEPYRVQNFDKKGNILKE